MTTWAALLALFLRVHASLEAKQSVLVYVTFEGKPLAGLQVIYRNLEGRKELHSVTDAAGVAKFTLDKRPEPYDFLASDDAFSRNFVLETPKPYRDGLKAVAMRTAEWQMRATPRICDELARTEDIPVGGLRMESATEYNAWYDSLSPEQVSNCKALAGLQSEVGSLAPWYFYAYKEQWPRCVGGETAELDWAHWYRGLMETATGAHPGRCQEDWEQWWSAKGYTRVPDPPKKNHGAN